MGQAAAVGEDPRVRAERLAARGRAAEAAGDFGEAVSAQLDAAAAYAEAGDEDAARDAAARVLALWPQFEEAKSLVMRPAKGAQAQAPRARGLRRLPKGGAAQEGEAAADPSGQAAPPVTSLPSIFIEMHAQALRLAGRERESRKRFDEALSAVEAEVERRRREQQWGEAFSAARSLLRVVRHAGGEGRLEDVRRTFIAVAREAARESLTAEYFARGRDELPVEALEAAVQEARALRDEGLLRELGVEMQEALARCAELLEALSNERTAAEAVLSWENSWTFLDSRRELKRALLDRPELAVTLAGPLSSLAGLAESHPARVELREFHDRLQAAVSRARERGPLLRERASRAAAR